MKGAEHNVARCVQQLECFFPGHCNVLICVLLLLIESVYFLLSGDRRRTVMYPFALLVFECVHTLDSSPVHRACLTYEASFSWRSVIMGRNIAFYYPAVKMINWCWEKTVSDVSFIAGLFCASSISQC